MKTNYLINGDALQVLRTLPNNSIDNITTDPPYGYSFMGKDWDKVVPSIAIWRECLRVLKDGAFMFVMSAPRQDVLSQMIVRLTESGFDTGFTSIYWTYASGFPKAMNISKAVDKKLKVKRISVGTKIIDKGIQKNSMHSCRNINRVEVPKEIATSEQAKQLDGSYGGFQPKPAVEIIIVCMKPLSEKTYVEQALKNGKGITWLNDVRIPYISKEELWKTNLQRSTENTNEGWKREAHKKPIHRESNIEGRFPANLLVSDDILNNGIVIKGVGGIRKNKTPNMGRNKIYGESGVAEGVGYGDEGSFSRYFDLDKWFEKAIEDLPKEVKKIYPFLICPKASKSERNKGCEELPDKIGGGMQGTADLTLKTGSGNIRNNIMKNNHPTVKPLKLMSYLITLSSREGDIILDPFVGSGTTCIAANILNRRWIGIELSNDYCKIAQARLNNCKVDVVQSNLPEAKIQAGKGMVIATDLCPKCNSKLYKGKHGIYCTNVNCGWKQ